MNVIRSPSPNRNARPLGVRPSVIVMHGTVGTDAGDLAWLRNPDAKVSYHYLVQRAGDVHMLVDPGDRAWHAGRSTWLGRANVNDFGIGIGLSNRGPGEPYTAAQYRSAGELVASLVRTYAIPLAAVVGHYHVSPGRKTDPWEHFNWGALFGHVHDALSALPPAA